MNSWQVWMLLIVSYIAVITSFQKYYLKVIHIFQFALQTINEELWLKNVVDGRETSGEREKGRLLRKRKHYKKYHNTYEYYHATCPNHRDGKTLWMMINPSACLSKASDYSLLEHSSILKWLQFRNSYFLIVNNNR